MKQVLVFGFYKQEPNHYGNIGDNLFKEAFQHLFPNLAFTFTDELTEQKIANYDTIFIGGGSLLNIQPNFDQSLLDLLKEKSIFYLGVGPETELHPWHKFLIRKAKLIACRSPNFDYLKSFNSNIFYCPDLVYSLSDQAILKTKKIKSILFLPNAYLINKYDGETWKHLTWEGFKSEMAQALDFLIREGYQLDFFSMCQNQAINDLWAAHEIIAKMHLFNGQTISAPLNTFPELTSLLSQYQFIISQRFHGTITAEILNSPCINIIHHDKLKAFDSENIANINYYGFNKGKFLYDFGQLKSNNLAENNIAIRTHLFEELKSRVATLI